MSDAPCSDDLPIRAGHRRALNLSGGLGGGPASDVNLVAVPGRGLYHGLGRNFASPPRL
ncbi:hypothetical protein [Holophaga foetida]|uniref:hypothetical protein n=1 Tax=Holophaga foetida TaxID=35839 RepID=UPI001FCAAC1D|nr:hypothetical protein [Holophaga foetida]